MAKPDLIKWVTDDAASKIDDPGSTKKLAGFLYLERPPVSYFNWLFNRIHKWFLGLQGNYFDIVVGSSAQVTALEATHTINQLDDVLVVAGTKVLFLPGTHTLTANLSLSNTDIKLIAETTESIIDVSTFQIILSGARSYSHLRVTNAGANDVQVSGSASKIILVGAPRTVVQVSNGASAEVFESGAGGLGIDSVTTSGDVTVGNDVIVTNNLIIGGVADLPAVTSDNIQSSIITALPPVTGGTPTAYTGSLGIISYEANRVYELRLHAANTGPSTLNINSVGAASIVKLNGSPLIAGEMTVNMVAKFLYNGANFVLLNPEKPFRGCLVYASADIIMNNNDQFDIPFDVEVYDTDSIHDNGVNNTRLVVPPDASIAVLKFKAAWVPDGPVAGERKPELRWNGGILWPGISRLSRSANSFLLLDEWAIPYTSPALFVTPGDYFTVNVYQNSGAQHNLYGTNRGCWFSMEILK